MRNKIQKTISLARNQKKFIIKTFCVLVGVLGLQLGLAAAYLYAFHAPAAHNIPISIVARDGVDTSKLASLLQDKGNGAFKVTVISSRDSAVDDLKDHKNYGAYISSVPRGELIVATASDKKLTDIVVKTLTDFDNLYQKQVRQQAALNPATIQLARIAVETPKVTDIAPLSSNDPNGTGLFYIAFSFVFGGYLAAVALNIVSDGRSFNHRNALIRSIAFIAYSLAGGLFISYIATHGINILPTNMFWPVVGIGALTTAGVSLLASAIISLLGTFGTGIVIVLFVILGTPASGGPLPLLLTGNGPWQWLSTYLPTGQAMGAIRQVAYFDSVQLWSHLWLLVAYVIVGFVLLVGFGLRHRSFDLIDDIDQK